MDVYEYNENGMNVATLKRCDSLQQRIKYLQTTFIEEVEHGFLKRMKTRAGRNVLKARRAKGRKKISA